MAKGPAIDEAQMRHAFDVPVPGGQTQARDVTFLHVLYGTGMTATEVAQPQVATCWTSAEDSGGVRGARGNRRQRQKPPVH